VDFGLENLRLRSLRVDGGALTDHTLRGGRVQTRPVNPNANVPSPSGVEDPNKAKATKGKTGPKLTLRFQRRTASNKVRKAKSEAAEDFGDQEYKPPSGKRARKS